MDEVQASRPAITRQRFHSSRGGGKANGGADSLSNKDREGMRATHLHFIGFPIDVQTFMRLQEFERVLVDGRGSALKKFGRNEYCVVVDWKDDAEQVLRAVQRYLPSAYWQFREIDENSFEINKGHATCHMSIPPGTDPESILQTINRVLMPDFEMRVFLPTVSDTISLLLRSGDWWNEFESAYPARLPKLFVTMDKRIQQIGME